MIDRLYFKPVCIAKGCILIKKKSGILWFIKHYNVKKLRFFTPFAVLNSRTNFLKADVKYSTAE